jgi:hypothetical protein
LVAGNSRIRIDTHQVDVVDQMGEVVDQMGEVGDHVAVGAAHAALGHGVCHAALRPA